MISRAVGKQVHLCNTSSQKHVGATCYTRILYLFFSLYTCPFLSPLYLFLFPYMYIFITFCFFSFLLPFLSVLFGISFPLISFFSLPSSLASFSWLTSWHPFVLVICYETLCLISFGGYGSCLLLEKCCLYALLSFASCDKSGC